MRTRPDILVLGGGGVLGQAWMTGVLAGIEDASGVGFGDCDYYVGTSAGSIVAAMLAAGRPLERPLPSGGETDAARQPAATVPHAGGVSAHLGAPLSRQALDWTLALASPLAAPGLRFTRRPGQSLRALALRAVPHPSGSLGDLRERIDAAMRQFDGRLRVVAVAREHGERVVFGSPGAPAATVGQAVQASCCVPWLFPAVELDGVAYVDGAVWSLTNLDVAPATRQTRVLCLNPIGGLWGSPTFAALGAGARAAATVEAGVLRARGARVQIVTPDFDAAAQIGTHLMDPGPRQEVLAAGYRQGLALG